MKKAKLESIAKQILDINNKYEESTSAEEKAELEKFLADLINELIAQYGFSVLFELDERVYELQKNPKNN